MPLPPQVARAALTDAYEEIGRLLGSLEEPDLMRPSRCAGWLVGDVVFHLLLDAQQVLVAMGTPAGGPADVDHVSYWRNHMIARTPETDAGQARFVRIGASAYARPAALASHWMQTSRAVVELAGLATGSRVVHARGRSMSISDLLAVSAVEATIHHLDMLGDLAGKPLPRPGALELTVRVLEALLGHLDRPEWDDQTFALKGSGRIPLSVPEQRLFDGYGIRLPLIG